MPHGWEQGGSATTTDIYPDLVRSGHGSLLTRGRQHVYNATPGTTYHFGAWAKVAQNSTSASAWVCISTYGSLDDPRDPTSAVCSTTTVHPENTWQYVSVSAIAREEHIIVYLLADNRPGVMAAWDDASLTVASTAATPTPAPTPRPVRPAPVPFDANALYDAMLQARSYMEQMGGLLDRVALEGPQSCADYNVWYNGLVRSPLYDGVSTDWSSLYGEYVWAVEHAVAKCAWLYEICTGGGGNITTIEYGEARIGIHEALERLGPATDKAKEIMGR